VYLNAEEDQWALDRAVQSLAHLIPRPGVNDSRGIPLRAAA